MIPVLDIQNLEITLAGKKIVHGLELRVEAGSITSLVGVSGSGKSLTALAVGGLLPKGAVVSGQVRVVGKVAYIFQDPHSSLNPVMRIAEQLREVSADPARICSKLSEASFTDPDRILKSFPHELSGGEKQRVMIAMALLMDPALLVADEPTTALDFKTEKEIMALLLDIQKKEGLSILLITHNLKLAMDTSNVIYVMESGRIVETLEKKTNFFRKESYTERLFEAANFVA